jgi:bacterioferritin-associated ferredoxin
VILCHCLGVSDREVHAEITAGAESVTDVRERCGASSRCGGCTPSVHDLIVRARLGVDVECGGVLVDVS